MRRFSAWLVLATLALVHGPAVEAAEAFHEPTSEPERALDAILKRVDHDPDVMENLVGGRGPGFRRTVDYRTMLTAPVLAAIAAREREAVKRDCGGRYKEGELCGLDYVPVTCAQDSTPLYYYRTDSESADKAQIAYHAPYAHSPQATYRLVKQDGTWKIDGIRCAEGDAFNMK